MIIIACLWLRSWLDGDICSSVKNDSVLQIEAGRSAENTVVGLISNGKQRVGDFLASNAWMRRNCVWITIKGCAAKSIKID